MTPGVALYRNMTPGPSSRFRSRASSHLPAAAKNATIEVQQMSAPYTSPNISAALGNNQLVVQLPNSARDGFLTLPNSSDPHRSVIIIPSGLYGLDALETEINHQINLEASNMGVGQFRPRDKGIGPAALDI